MGLTNKYNCPISQDITNATATNIVGVAHSMQGKNLSGGRVSAVFFTPTNAGGPIGEIEAFMPNNTWHAVVRATLDTGTTVLDAPRWPTMRLRLVNNGSSNTIDGHFAENAG